MEFHQLRDFVAVATTGSFSEAASKCRVAQPSLSKAIQRLEVEVGDKLFIRLKRRAVLTPAGEMLLKHANRILTEIEKVKREIAEAHGLRRGTVSVGVLPTIAPYFLPRVISQFREACPGLEIIIRESTTADLLKLVDACELDLALVTLPIRNDDRIETQVLFTEELVLAVPSKHPLAVKEKIRLVDLDKEQFILMQEDDRLGNQILSSIGQTDSHLNVVLRSSQIETIQSLVMAGVGIAFVPHTAKIGGRTPLVYRSMERPRPMRTIIVGWRKGREFTRAAAEFLKHLQQVGKAFDQTATPS
jgi:LysR family hydrogen peroxide-inducible transcriptional activator